MNDKINHLNLRHSERISMNVSCLHHGSLTIYCLPFVSVAFDERREKERVKHEMKQEIPCAVCNVFVCCVYLNF